MSTPLTAETFTPLDDLDPATPGDPFTRLRYHYGQLLGAEDFETEQRYFLLRSRLHNALLHGMGTVWGLRVRAEETADPAGLRLICEPGLAIDALGREVYVPLSVCLDVTGLAATPFWADLAPPPAAPPAAGEGGGEGGGEEAPDPRRRVYVVLSYRACLSAPVPAVTPPCSDSDASLVHSRVLDGYRICLQAEAPPDPAATQRDVTRLAGPPGPRERLLDLILHPTLDLARFWGGADEAPVAARGPGPGAGRQPGGAGKALRGRGQRGARPAARGPGGGRPGPGGASGRGPGPGRLPGPGPDRRGGDRG